MSCKYGRGFRCCQACLITRPPSNKLNSHRYIIRLSVKRTSCKRSQKGDELSKQNTPPTSGCVCSAMGIDSSTQPKISVLTFLSTRQHDKVCTVCVREKKVKPKAKADFNLRLRSTHAVPKHSRALEFGGHGCVQARFVCWSRANTYIWTQRGVSQSVSVLAGPLCCTLTGLTHNPSR